jgi:hypothetical protein
MQIWQLGDLGVHSGSPRLMQKDGASRFCSDSPLGPKSFQASHPVLGFLRTPCRSCNMSRFNTQQAALNSLESSLRAILTTGLELVPPILLLDGLLAT